MTTDYIAAATAVASGEAPAAPVVEAPAAPAVAEVKPEVAATAPTTPEASAPAAAAEAPKPDAPKPDRVTKSFEDLAREKAAFRAEKEKFSGGRAKSLDEAAAKGDAMALLAAAGIPWSKAAQQVLEGVGKTATPEQPPEPDERDRRLAALEQEIAGTKAQNVRASLMRELTSRTAAAPAKFKYVAGLKTEHEAIKFIESYYNQTGELPGGDINESMEIALEAVETHYAKEAQKYASLTPVSANATISTGKQAVPAVGAVSQQAPKTLTNSTGSGPSSASGSKSRPKTSDEYIAAAIEAATAQ